MLSSASGDVVLAPLPRHLVVTERSPVFWRGGLARDTPFHWPSRLKAQAYKQPYSPQLRHITTDVHGWIAYEPNRERKKRMTASPPQLAVSHAGMPSRCSVIRERIASRPIDRLSLGGLGQAW